ncbi:MAG: ABC transporter ATP-binding protein [Candidatus Omnitrophica bacterium]|nr:ABC transporter ATP-binding protein [Candidatus Omnitrophota bacterium]MDD5246546.1 ABC transporter ATP-binding protein [Candidatus Omnitrophota bacterium]MDD5512213.1 ABC transporter ATP-binding protein [Candidatus Omnitrophota bacterium]
MTMLEARGIQKAFNNGKKDIPVLKGIDLKIEKGSFIVITGPSGAGKSTLLHILGGLDAPSAGEVRFTGQSLYALNDALLSRMRNQSIGFIFQFYHLLGEFNVLENVLMPALIKSSGRAQRKQSREKACALLLKVGLGERLDHYPSQLSGGERQRVAIVRALINSPQILFCDEPTGNLDSATGSEIFDLIRKINLDDKMTVVVVTHNTELVKGAGRVYHLKDGVLVN